MLEGTNANDDPPPLSKHPVPASFVSDGPIPGPAKLQPRADARAIVAFHSAGVGNRQSPADDPSVNSVQSPLFRPAAAWFAVAQSADARQSACFNQISPVTASVTVPFPQST